MQIDADIFRNEIIIKKNKHICLIMGLIWA